jgi:hypothetical protein
LFAQLATNVRKRNLNAETQTKRQIMSSIRYRHFNRPNFIKSIREDVLRQFLEPFREYLDSRGLHLGADRIDCGMLGQILATPDCDTPNDLIETLEICDAVCFPDAVDELIELDNHRDEEILDGEHSGADVVLLTWCHDPEAVERIHDRAALELERSMCVYRATEPLQEHAFSSRQMTRIQNGLRPMFENQLRGPSCRVTLYERPNGGYALVIRHGDPIHKTDAISDDGDAQSVVFRPERTDLAFYDPSRNEWRISGRGKWLQDLYSSTFARIFHGEGCQFRRSVSYTLDPLFAEGLSILDHQTDHVRSVRVAELQVELSGASVWLSGRNLRDAFETLETPLVAYGVPKSARFCFNLVNRRCALNATIHQGRVSVRGDIDHPAIEDWLAETGFLTSHAHDAELHRSEAVASH